MANGIDLGYNEGLIEQISQYYPDLSIEELNELIESVNLELNPPSSKVSNLGGRLIGSQASRATGIAGVEDWQLGKLLDEGLFERGRSENLDMRNLLENIASSRNAQSTVPPYGKWGDIDKSTDVETYIPSIEGNRFTGTDSSGEIFTPFDVSVSPTAFGGHGYHHGDEAWQKHEVTYPFNVAASVPYPEDMENAHSYIDDLIAQQGGVSTEETAHMVDLLDMIKQSLQ